MKIFLIGFMGAGKSLIGRNLADRLGLSFLDLDDYLEEGEQQSIQQIFSNEGEAAFRAIEKKYLKKTINLQDYIVATGGGTPCFFDNMDWMKRQGYTIFLEVDAKIICERLRKERAHRPLLANQTEVELLKFIENKLHKRQGYYKQAALTYQADKGLEEILVELEAKINEMAIASRNQSRTD